MYLWYLTISVRQTNLIKFYRKHQVYKDNSKTYQLYVVIKGIRDSSSYEHAGIILAKNRLYDSIRDTQHDFATQYQNVSVRPLKSILEMVLGNKLML